jgi:hypothetical protein
MSRFVAIALACLACASSAPRPAGVSPTALEDISLVLPTPEDARPSASAGCGQFAPDLPERIEKALITSLGDAGAQFAVRAPWKLSVVLTFAGTGAEYAGPSRTPAGISPGLPPDAPPVFAEQRGGVNAGWTDTRVALDATLRREGSVVWEGTVTGRVRSAPCVDPRGHLDEAMRSAVSQLRAELIRRISAARARAR